MTFRRVLFFATKYAREKLSLSMQEKRNFMTKPLSHSILTNAGSKMMFQPARLSHQHAATEKFTLNIRDYDNHYTDAFNSNNKQVSVSVHQDNGWHVVTCQNIHDASCLHQEMEAKNLPHQYNPQLNEVSVHKKNEVALLKFIDNCKVAEPSSRLTFRG